MSSRVKNKVSAAAIVRGTGAVPVPAVQIVTMASAAPQIQPGERASDGLVGTGRGVNHIQAHLCTEDVTVLLRREEFGKGFLKVSAAALLQTRPSRGGLISLFL